MAMGSETTQASTPLDDAATDVATTGSPEKCSAAICPFMTSAISVKTDCALTVPTDIMRGCQRERTMAMYTTTMVFTANYDMNQNGCGRTIPRVMTTTMIIATLVVIVMMIVMVIG